MIRASLSNVINIYLSEIYTTTQLNRCTRNRREYITFFYRAGKNINAIYDSPFLGHDERDLAEISADIDL